MAWKALAPDPSIAGLNFKLHGDRGRGGGGGFVANRAADMVLLLGKLGKREERWWWATSSRGAKMQRGREELGEDKAESFLANLLELGSFVLRIR